MAARDTGWHDHPLALNQRVSRVFQAERANATLLLDDTTIVIKMPRLSREA